LLDTGVAAYAVANSLASVPLSASKLVFAKKFYKNLIHSCSKLCDYVKLAQPAAVEGQTKKILH
jgi:hypothetical protein